jgi:hypothetical protein
MAKGCLKWAHSEYAHVRHQHNKQGGAVVCLDKGQLNEGGQKRVGEAPGLFRRRCDSVFASAVHSDAHLVPINCFGRQSYGIGGVGAQWGRCVPRREA